MENQKRTVGELYDPTFAELTPGQIKERLDGLSYNVRKEKYTRPLLPEELSEQRERFADAKIEIADVQAEIKAFTDLRKSDIKTKEKETAELLENIRTKTMKVDGQIFDIDDQENKVMVSYDEKGVCVGVRALKPEERQTGMRSIPNFSIEDKTGTHGK